MVRRIATWVWSLELPWERIGGRSGMAFGFDAFCGERDGLDVQGGGAAFGAVVAAAVGDDGGDAPVAAEGEGLAVAAGHFFGGQAQVAEAIVFVASRRRR